MAKVNLSWNAVTQDVDDDPVRNVIYQLRRGGVSSSNQIYSGSARLYTDQSAPDNSTVIYYLRSVVGTCIGDWTNISVKTGTGGTIMSVKFTLSVSSVSIDTLRGGTATINVTSIDPTTAGISVRSNNTSVATAAISGSGASRVITITSAGTEGTARITVTGSATGRNNTIQTIDATVKDTVTPTCTSVPARPTVSLLTLDEDRIRATISSPTTGACAATSYQVQIRRKGTTSWSALALGKLFFLI